MRPALSLLGLFLSLPALAADAPAQPGDDGASEDASADEPAAAEPLDLVAIRDRIESLTDIDIRDDVAGLVADGFVLQDSVLTLSLDDGVLFPIFAGYTAEEWTKRDKSTPPKDEEARAEWERKRANRAERELVGFAFVGAGTVQWLLNDKSDRQRYANRQVRLLKRDPAALADFVKGRATEKAGVTRGIVLTTDPEVLGRLDGLTPAGGDGTKVVIGNSDVEIDAELNWSKLVGEARRTLKERVELLGLKRDAVRDLARSRHLPDPAWKPRLYVDVFTDRRYGYAVDGSWSASSKPEDQWLGFLRDDNGLNDQRLRAEIFTVGESLKGWPTGATLGGEAFAPMDEYDPLSPPFPPVYPEPVFADATVKAEISRDGFYMDVAADVEFTVRAHGSDLQVFTVRIGGAQADRFHDKWRFGGITLEDGTPVTYADPEDEEFHEIAGPVTVVLPEPLPEGEEITLRTTWSGTWPYGNATDLGSLGLSTGLQDVLPSLEPGLAGNPWRFRIRLGTPVAQELAMSVSGVTEKEWEEGGWRWVQAAREDADAMWADVAVGRWRTVDEPATAGMPAVKVHMFSKHTGEMETFPPEMRRIISYYEGFLPKFPFDEIELFQAPSGFYGFVWIAPHAMVNLQATMVYDQTGAGASLFRDDTPHLESGVLAHELAHMYWGHVQRPATIRDFWMAETFAETYACMYVGAAYGPYDYERRMEAKRETWEKRLAGAEYTASLTDAYSDRRTQPAVVYQYGPLVFSEMLRKRIGDGPFYAALDVILQENHEQPITTEALQVYFEKASGQSLRDYFDYWVRGGFIPETVALEWREERGDGGRRVVGTVTTDVPFGTMDVPVRVWTSGKKFQDVWVTVVDGVGAVETSEPVPNVKKVELDPDGLILARKRTVTQLK